MLTLIYRSRAAAGLTDDDLGDISAISSARNKRLGVSGFLVDFDGLFLQVLEGDEAAVDGLMQVIRLDPRHSEVEVLLAKRTSRRQFGFWGMNRGPLADAGFRQAALGGDLPAEVLRDRSSDVRFVHEVLFRGYLHALHLAKADPAARAAIAAALD